MKKEIVKSTILLTTLCFALSQSVFAAENKELVRMDLDQNSDGSVKVNIYTDKPYTEQIIVNKKPDNKYVILLPETVNAMGVKPDVSGLSNVKGVDVKTQQYSSLPNKGYTKITIDGKRPIEVVPQTHVSRTMQAPRRSVAEQTRSVMSQSNRRPYVTPQQVQMTVPQRVLNQSRPVTHSDFVPAVKDNTMLKIRQDDILNQHKTMFQDLFNKLVKKLLFHNLKGQFNNLHNLFNVPFNHKFNNKHN